MARDLSKSVVVVTGASSGIGRAAARRFAGHGAFVVITARRTQALEDLAGELGRDKVLAVPADVADPDAVERVAHRAAERFGGIDVWVNNASVVAFGKLADIPPEAFRRVVEVNLLGYANGARAAHPYLKARGGTLINVASLNGKVPAPLYTPYIASKFGVFGLSLALRQEWRPDGIAVATVLPAGVDTPLFQQGGNWYGKRAKGLVPSNDPDRIARRVVACARRPRRSMPAGVGSRPLLYAEGLAPALTERVVAVQARWNNFDRSQPADPSPGNLFEPSDLPTTERGGWSRRNRRVLAAVAVAAAPVGAAVAAVRARRS